MPYPKKNTNQNLMKTQSFKSGKITVNEDTIQVKGLFNTEVIQKHQIQSINVFGSMFTGILCVCTVINAVRGFKILTGNRMITIGRTFDNPIVFWIPKNEVQAFKNSI